MRFIPREPGKGYVDALTWVPKEVINVTGLKSALTFNFVEEREVICLSLFQETEHHLLIPRAFFRPEKVNFDLIDCRPLSYPHADITSRVTLDFKNPALTVQRDAMNALLASQGGILQLACGVGKTVIALDFIARRKVPALILVDNTQLMAQWKKEIELHLDVPGGVGLIQGDSFDWKKSVVLGTYQTLSNRADVLPEEVRRWFGTIVWDEGHHIGARTFAKTAELFYGYRLALSATPKRDDGLNVIYDLHIGNVLFKYLKQELKPRIYFVWTGMSLNMEDPEVHRKVTDVNGELHITKLAGFFGQWRERLAFVINEVRRAVAQNRKVLVLSNSVDELINLLAMWNGKTDLFTDLPVPTSEEVGAATDPELLPPRKKKNLLKKIAITRRMLADPMLNPVKRENSEAIIAEIDFQLRRDEAARMVASEMNKRQKAYLKDLLAMPSDAGLMIYKVKPDERMRMLKEKTVTFAVSKYGKEGLDEAALDTVIACEPMSSRNMLQQFMGRVLRTKPGKKTPVVVFLEDDIGPMSAMCRTIRRHLRGWPLEEGGPYTYELEGHPRKFPQG
jgi:superfamily II DNA or RNA helicase